MPTMMTLPMGSLPHVEELYESFPSTSGFDPSSPNDGPDDDDVPMSEKSAPFDNHELFEYVLSQAVGGASIEEIKAAGLGYIDTDPDPSPKPGARRLRRYWVRGEGALKIRWNTPGDWTRCVRHMRKYVGAGAEGLCTVYHKQATGMYTGDSRHRAMYGGGKKSGMVADIETKNLVVESTMLRLENLYLSKAMFDGWERIETKSGDIYDTGYNVLTDQWEAHSADNFNDVRAVADTEVALYEYMNGM